MKWILIFSLFSLASTQAANCNLSYSQEKLNNQLAELLRLPEYESLAQKNIVIKEFTAEDYFLKAYPKKILSRQKRVYVLGINPKLFKCAPSDPAMKAILAHELMHLKDYANISLVKFGWRYLFHPSKVERETDYRVLKMGLVNGLIEYRRWIYRKLRPAQLKKKQKRYYTPKEIHQLVQIGEITPLD